MALDNIRNIVQCDSQLTWLNIPSCQKCDEKFTGFVKGGSSHRPFVLRCNHLMCEKCLYACVHARIAVCKICNIKSPIDTSSKLFHQFDFNYHLMGLMHQRQFLLSIPNSANEETPKDTNEKLCDECNMVCTVEYCRDCDVPMCKDCFQKIHNVGKTIKKHKLFPLETKEIAQIDISVCSVHKLTTDFMCMLCDSKACTKCCVDEHKGHEIKTIKIVNEEVKPCLREVLNELDSAKALNEHAKKAIEENILQQQKFLNDTLNEITNYFQFLHSLLQNSEKEVLSKLKKHYMTISNKTIDMQQSLAIADEALTKSVGVITRCSKNVPKHSLITDHLREAKKNLYDMPCSVEFSNNSENPFVFRELASLHQDFEKFFELTFNDKLESKMTTYAKRNASDLLIDALTIIPQETTELCANIKDKLNRNTSIASSSASFSSFSKYSKKSLTKAKHEEFKIHIEINPINPTNVDLIKNSQKVIVSYIKHPNELYVQNQTFLCKANEISELCQKEANDSIAPETILIGAHYLIKNKSENKWYRGKVIQELKKKRYEVFFIDFGKYDEVPDSRILQISSSLSEKYPPGAIHCCLYNILPLDGKKWPSDINQIMSDFIDNKSMRMYIVDNKDPCNVDLISMCTNNYPKSLRNYLIYIGACKNDVHRNSSEQKFKNIKNFEKIMKIYNVNVKEQIAPVILSLNTSYKVTILHAISPFEFYVSKKETSDEYHRLQFAVNEFYEMENKRILYDPCVGLTCVFQDNEGDWLRGKVMKVLNGACEIYSVDTGRRQVVDWKQIYEISSKFAAMSSNAISCKLFQVTPFKQNKYKWTTEASEFFCRVVFSKKDFQITIAENHTDHYNVTLMQLDKMKDICINALLVKHGFAVSIGKESETVEFSKEDHNEGIDYYMNVSTTSSSKKTMNNRTRVNIMKIVSPDEMYVSIIKNKENIENMQEMIQKKMDERMDIGFECDWREDQICVVFNLDSSVGAREWYRGRIINIIDENKYGIFLLDLAVYIESHRTNIDTMPPGFGQILPGATKCHMACVGAPGGTTWPASSIDALKIELENAKNLYISIQGTRTIGSIPVIFWNMATDSSKALAPSVHRYVSITNKLVQYGYCHLKEKILPISAAPDIDEVLSNFDQDLDEILCNSDKVIDHDSANSTIVDDSTILDYNITPEITFITKWLPPKPIGKAIFCGTPTYIDDNAVIYLHDSVQDNLFREIENVINVKFNAETKPVSRHYRNQQPCIARFHVDNKFYRGLVKKALSPTRYKVHFIDYGNIEDCDSSDLRQDVICGDIPVLANKYRLSGVIPKTETWTTDVLDIMHSLIVGKMCLIRADTSNEHKIGVIPCFISIVSSNVDVIKYLTEEIRLVDRQKQITNTESINEDALSSPRSKLKIGANFSNVNEGASTSTRQLKFDDFKDTFFKLELDEVYNSAVQEHGKTSEEDEQDSQVFDDNLDAVHFLSTWSDYKGEEDGEIVEQESSLTNPESPINFDLSEFDTSTQIETPVELTVPTFHGFPKLKLDSSVKGFFCEITSLVSSTKLSVYPHIESHETFLKEMMAKIQVYARKHRKCPDIELDMPCLAVFNQDKLWYRGLIEEYNEKEGFCRIFFVDYLNRESVQITDILKCPIALRKRPLRNLQVKLYNVSPNTRLREADVGRKLGSLLEGKKVFVKVIKYLECPEVELYTDENCVELIYKKMYAENFFTIKH